MKIQSSATCSSQSDPPRPPADWRASLLCPPGGAPVRIHPDAADPALARFRVAGELPLAINQYGSFSKQADNSLVLRSPLSQALPEVRATLRAQALAFARELRLARSAAKAKMAAAPGDMQIDPPAALAGVENAAVAAGAVDAAPVALPDAGAAPAANAGAAPAVQQAQGGPVGPAPPPVGQAGVGGPDAAAAPVPQGPAALLQGAIGAAGGGINLHINLANPEIAQAFGAAFRAPAAPAVPAAREVRTKPFAPTPQPFTDKSIAEKRDMTQFVGNLRLHYGDALPPQNIADAVTGYTEGTVRRCWEEHVKSLRTAQGVAPGAPLSALTWDEALATLKGFLGNPVEEHERVVDLFVQGKFRQTEAQTVYQFYTEVHNAWLLATKDRVTEFSAVKAFEGGLRPAIGALYTIMAHAAPNTAFPGALAMALTAEKAASKQVPATLRAGAGVQKPRGGGGGGGGTSGAVPAPANNTTKPSGSSSRATTRRFMGPILDTYPEDIEFVHESTSADGAQLFWPHVGRTGPRACWDCMRAGAVAAFNHEGCPNKKPGGSKRDRLAHQDAPHGGGGGHANKRPFKGGKGGKSGGRGGKPRS